MERNPCHDLGCHGVCCQNVEGQYAASETWFLKSFPEAVRVNSMEELEEKKNPTETGVYYHIRHPNAGWVDFLINGSCPNRDGNGSCVIHQERYYPNACKNVIPGSPECHRCQAVQRVNEAVVARMDSPAGTELKRIIVKLES
jgi:hypothetical protein